MAAVGSVDGHRKGGRKPGFGNYRADVLLSIIEVVKPTTLGAWNEVANRYMRETGETAPRSAEDLKRHFNQSLCNSGKKLPEDSPRLALTERAQAIHASIWKDRGQSHPHHHLQRTIQSDSRSGDNLSLHGQGNDNEHTETESVSSVEAAASVPIEDGTVIHTVALDDNENAGLPSNYSSEAASKKRTLDLYDGNNYIHRSSKYSRLNYYSYRDDDVCSSFDSADEVHASNDAVQRNQYNNYGSTKYIIDALEARVAVLERDLKAMADARREERVEFERLLREERMLDEIRRREERLENERLRLEERRLDEERRRAEIERIRHEDRRLEEERRREDRLEFERMRKEDHQRNQLILNAVFKGKLATDTSVQE